MNKYLPVCIVDLLFAMFYISLASYIVYYIILFAITTERYFILFTIFGTFMFWVFGISSIWCFCQTLINGENK